MKQPLLQIIHISKDVHSKLKLFVAQQAIKNIKTNLSQETEKAILKHISGKQ